MSTVLLRLPAPDLDRDSWLTPRWILDALGSFDLDPCACAAARDWVCARARTYTRAEDGLRREWFGRVFLNPPFSRIGPWVERLAQHANGIALLPAGHDTAAWERFVWRRASAVFLLRGRVRFAAPDGFNTRGRPRCPVALVAYGRTNRDSLERYPGCGVLLTAWTVRGLAANQPSDPDSPFPQFGDQL